MHPVDLVIFDLDGTLVDSEPLANRVLWEHLCRIGLPWPLAQTEARFTGRALADCFAIVRDELGIDVPATFVDAMQTETLRRLEQELQPMPGAAAMLAALDLPRCIASGSEPRKIDLELRVTGLRGHFADDALFSVWQVARGKPAPDLFLHAAAAMGGVAPHRCVVVEDSGPGVAAGLAAGMRVLGYRITRPGAHRFDDLEELPRLLAG